MTQHNSPAVVEDPAKPSWFSGCVVTALAILFAILGIYDILFASVLAFVFSSARMLSPATIAVLLIICLDCFIYAWLVFRIKRQHWLISVALLAIVWLVLPLPLRYLLNTSTARVRNNGFSMGTTLPDGGYLLADRLAYQHTDPQRGDIVIFSFPLDPDQDLIKRVIGLPGESIAVKDGTVTVNGTPLKEPYSTAPALYDGTWVVPEGQLFVLGDNRNDSRDSHQWGFLPRENIIGKVVWIYYPFARFGKIIDVHYVP
jgi:signal peptidase I